VRRFSLWVGLAVVALSACSSSGGKPPASTTTSTSAPSPASTTATTSTPTSRPNPSTTRATVVPSTTHAGCPPPGGSTAPVTTPKSPGSSLLTTVTIASSPCTDRVIFGFITKSGGTPNCNVAYNGGPFTEDASGKPVAVAGAAFVVVRCTAAYTYDPETNRTTYTGPQRFTPSGAPYVRDLVKTGDFEGVVSWVVGLGGRRSFAVAVKTVPPGISTLTITFA